MKKYRTVPATILLFVAFFMLISGNVPKYLPLVLFALALVAYLIMARGSMYFAKANKIMQSGVKDSIEKARPYYEKAYKAGVPDNFLLYIGVLMVQYYDYETGGEILKKLSKSRNTKTAFQAKNALSMYYWIKRDINSAIEASESAKAMNLKDRNMYINLCTYYLAENNVKKFKLTLKEAYKNQLESPALLDLEAIMQILDDNYQRAGGFLKSLFEIKEPQFIDPYLHYAIIYMHYGEVDKAIKSLERGLEIAYFSNTSVVKQDEIKRIIKALENPKARDRFIKDVLSNKLDAINGRYPDEIEEKIDAEYPKLPEFIKEDIKDEDIDEKDDGDIDTSITEDDEKWLKKHQD